MDPATLEKHGRELFRKHFTVESSRPVRDRRVLLFTRTAVVATTCYLFLLRPTYAASLVAAMAVRKIARPRKVGTARGDLCSFEGVDRLASSTSSLKCLICRRNVNSFEKCVEDKERDAQGTESVTAIELTRQDRQ